MTANETRYQSRLRWTTLLSGVAFAVITVIAFVVLGHASTSPRIGSSTAKIASFYRAHKTAEETAATLLAVIAALLAVFATSCKTMLANPRSPWPALLFGGGMVGAASFLLAGTVHFALADGASHHLNPAALQALNALDIHTGLAFTAGVGILLIGAAATMIPRTDTLRVTGWIAVPLAAVNLTPAGVAAFPASALWLIAVAILLTRTSHVSRENRTVSALIA